VSEVFVTQTALERFRSLLTDASVHLVTERAAKALSDTVTPVGIVAVCSVPSTSLDDVLAAAARLVAVAVEISEPGNAGTLIRIADAMGADAVVLAGHSVDPYNGKCLRASAGSIFAIPVVSEADASHAVSALRGAGLQVLATTVDGEVTLDDADLDDPTAWLFGPESHGLPRELAEMAAHRVRIPMPGSAESLNVASAAAICLYQSARAHRRG
jgi:TrmH family RNA methyltransferase